MSSSPLSSAAMEREENREEEMRLKAAFHYAVGKTCEQMGKKLTQKNDLLSSNEDGRYGSVLPGPSSSVTTMTTKTSPELKFSKKFISALSEVAWRQMTRVYATDLSTFARHAKRTTIGEADVVLIARHNPDLEAKLNVKSVELAAGRQSNKRKATASSAGGGGGGGPSKKSKT